MTNKRLAIFISKVLIKLLHRVASLILQQLQDRCRKRYKLVNLYPDLYMLLTYQRLVSFLLLNNDLPLLRRCDLSPHLPLHDRPPHLYHLPPLLHHNKPRPAKRRITLTSGQFGIVLIHGLRELGNRQLINIKNTVRLQNSRLATTILLRYLRKIDPAVLQRYRY